MKRIKQIAVYSFCTLLAIVLYVLFIPVTIIQAVIFLLISMVTDKDLFERYSPISAIVAEKVMKHYC